MAVGVELTRRLFTVDQYARMVEVGILTKYDRAELIHGEIVEKMPIGRGHFAAVAALNELFSERLIDVEGGAIEIYRDQAPEGYLHAQRITRGASFSPQAFPDLVLSVSDILR